MKSRNYKQKNKRNESNTLTTRTRGNNNTRNGFLYLTSGQNTMFNKEPFIRYFPKLKNHYPKTVKENSTPKNQKQENNRSKKKNLHDDVGRPKNAVPVEFLCRIEPETITLFPTTTRASVSVQVGLEPPRFPFDVS